jgi:lipoprotein NlpI
LLALPAAGLAQPPGDRNKSRAQNRLGWELMQSKQFANAVKAFQAAVEIDPTFEMPWYGVAAR